MKDSFILYTSYTNAVLGLSNEQAGELIKAIFLFVTTGEPQEVSDPTTRFAYNLITDQIVQNDKKYAQKCERLKANARKGGLQKAANASNNLQTQANGTEDSNDYQKLPIATNCYQMAANISNCKQIGGDMICNDMICNDKEEKEDKKKDEPSMCVDTHSSSSKPSDFEGLMQYWNDAVEKSGSAMNKLLRMTDRRVSAVRARMREHKPDGLAAVKRMIDKAVRSDFLNGRNSRNAIFTFDRLMAPEMFQKTLEGNYDNKPKDEQQPTAEQSSIGRLMQEQEAQRQDQNEEQRQRYKGMIAIVERNPQHRCRDALVMAYKNGTLKSLGIEWKPE